jgi:hypothetical protein
MTTPKKPTAAEKYARKQGNDVVTLEYARKDFLAGVRYERRRVLRILGKHCCCGTNCATIREWRDRIRDLKARRT